MSVRLVLGPMVRRVDQTTASIWVQVDRGATLVGRASRGGKKKRRDGIDSLVAHTVQVGDRHFAMLYFEKLAPGALYTYTIAAAADGRASITSASGVRAKVKKKAGTAFDLFDHAFGDAPAFRTLTKPGKEPLRLAFGSCRCFAGGYHGDLGADLLALYGQHLGATFEDRLTQWPQLLLFLGDQIYGDNVGKPAVKEIEKQGQAIQLKTMAVADWSDRARVKELIANGTIGSAWDSKFSCVRFADFATLYELSWSVYDVRRLLANLPSFMIPDDHEVADDWNITGGWMEQGLSDKDWRAAISNGLMAYWVYQGWGNVSPADAAAHEVLGILARHHEGDAADKLVAKIERQLAGTVRAPLYYTIPTTPPIIALDARADRAFTAPTDVQNGTGDTVVVYTHRDDQILSDEQFEWLGQQLEASETPILLSSVPLFQTMVADRALAQTRPPDNSLIADLQGQSQENSNLFEETARSGDADTWFAFPGSVLALLALLASREAVYFLAGDVHYSYVYVTNGYPYFSPQKGGMTKTNTRLVHAVSSPLQHEMSAAKVEILKEYSGKQYRGADGSEGKAGVPDSNPVRDPFDVPNEAFDANGSIGPRYTTKNNIGFMRIGDTETVIAWLGEPVKTDSTLTEIGIQKIKK